TSRATRAGTSCCRCCSSSSRWGASSSRRCERSESAGRVQRSAIDYREPGQTQRRELGGHAMTTPDPRRWLALTVMTLGAFMVLVDTTVVNVAIPSIRNNLHASYADTQWVVAGYQLAY